MFNKGFYISSEVWVGNDYLIQPDTAAKRCLCCGKLFYAVEFPMIAEVVDGVLPVCIQCFRSRKLADTVSGILNSMAETRICRKCGEEKHITSYLSYRSGTNDFDGRCADCRPAANAWWEKDAED